MYASTWCLDGDGQQPTAQLHVKPLSPQTLHSLLWEWYMNKPMGLAPREAVQPPQTTHKKPFCSLLWEWYIHRMVEGS